jgi:hypothetical protein
MPVSQVMSVTRVLRATTLTSCGAQRGKGVGVVALMVYEPLGNEAESFRRLFSAWKR